MSRKKNILCVIGQLGNGGTERQLYLFLKYLDHSQYCASVLVAGTEGGVWDEQIRTELGVDIHFMGNFPAWKKLLLFKSEIKKIEPDVIFSWSFFTNAFSLVSGRIPFVGSLRQQYAEEQRNLGAMRRKASLLPRKIVVNSNAIADELVSVGVNRKKIEVIFNIFESSFINDKDFTAKRSKIRSEFCKKYSIPENCTIIAGVGRNSPTKDFPFFVDVINILRKQQKNIHAVLIGSGGLAVQEKIAELNLQDNFTITGEIPDAKELLPMADIYFLSSRQEGMPNVLIEAIDAGVAPFATDVGGVRDIFSDLPENLLNSVLIQNRDPKQTAVMLCELIDNKNLRQAVSNQTQSFLRKLSPEIIMQQYCNILFP